MEPIDKSLISHATKLFNALAKRCSPDKIMPIRGSISEFLFLSFLNYYEDKDSAISIVFHGTDAVIANSIQLYGMFDPTFDNYKVKNGNAWGKGVYVTPNIDFAMPYAKNRGNGIIIAGLAIKGETKTDNLVMGSNDLKSDSQVIGDIVVLRSTCQMLPLFAVSTKYLANNDTSVDENYVDALLTIDPPNDAFVEHARHLKTMFPEVKFGVIYQLIIRKNGDINAVYNDLNDLDYTVY